MGKLRGPQLFILAIKANPHDAICGNNLQHTADIVSCERKNRTSLSQLVKETRVSLHVGPTSCYYKSYHMNWPLQIDKIGRSAVVIIESSLGVLSLTHTDLHVLQLQMVSRPLNLVLDLLHTHCKKGSVGLVRRVLGFCRKFHGVHVAELSKVPVLAWLATPMWWFESHTGEIHLFALCYFWGMHTILSP